MGFFGRFAFTNGRWSGEDPTETPYLVIEIHDSDIATVDYRPTWGAAGRFYLGVVPWVYFEDPRAQTPVDGPREALGFARWVQLMHGREVGPPAVEQLFAKENEDESQDVFVEETVRRLLVLAGLPPPPDLPSP